MSPTEDEDLLDVEMSGSYGRPEGVASVLVLAGHHMREMPDGTRYDFALSITECDTGGGDDG